VSSDYWIIGIAAASVTLIGLLVWRWFRRPKGTTHDALRAVSVFVLRDVLLPDGMGGQIYVDHLLLTNRGIAVVDVKDFAGAVFASDRMEEWTVIGEGRRFGFPNPQGTLLDRVAAVRQVVSNVPVEGYIVFGRQADFTKGRPRHVMVASDLEKHFGKPGVADRDRLSDAYAHYWNRLKGAATQVSGKP